MKKAEGGGERGLGRIMGGGFTLCMVPIGTLSPIFFIFSITLSPILRVSTNQPPKKTLWTLLDSPNEENV